MKLKKHFKTNKPFKEKVSPYELTVNNIELEQFRKRNSESLAKPRFLSSKLSDNSLKRRIEEKNTASKLY